MFRKSNKDVPEVAQKKLTPSVISSNINILGNIISDGMIDFDGSIDGNIYCHNLIVRQNARINGEVKADTVQISGRVFGTIRARVVTLHRSAHVEGVVMHEQLTVEDGATVDGKLKKTAKFEASNNAPSLTANNNSNNAEADEDALIMEHIRLIAANN